MTSPSMIPLASIDVGSRLRTLDPDWVETLAEDIAANEQKEPIRVVAFEGGFRLIKGARRMAALSLLQRQEVWAIVLAGTAIRDEAALRLEEIKATMLRGDLTALDRAVHVATWKEIYEAAQGPAKRGRKPKEPEPDDAEEMSAKFALNFSDAAQKTLRLSRRSVYLALKIARIAPDLRVRIALHSIADTQRELLLLAELTPVRQAAIVDLLTADPAQATSVTDAIALLDSVPTPRPVPAYERIHERFAKLKTAEQERFFDLSADAIEVWLAKRAAKARKSA